VQNKYATGATVYKGGLPNAQSGTLNPDGYIQREQSNRRSGLAAFALNKRGLAVGQSMSPHKKQLNLAGLYVSPTGKLGRLK
jgi:hypothetical protein